MSSRARRRRHSRVRHDASVRVDGVRLSLALEARPSDGRVDRERGDTGRRRKRRREEPAATPSPRARRPRRAVNDGDSEPDDDDEDEDLELAPPDDEDGWD